MDHLYNLDQQGVTIVEYIWVDGSATLRGKARTIPKKITNVDQLPDWNYDGSSCYQAVTSNSEVILKPVCMVPCPFRGGDNRIALCESWKWEDATCQKLIPANTNFRHFAKAIFEAGKGEEPWYGIEQEYTMLTSASKFSTRPYGWPEKGFPGNQGPYYCSVGGNVCFGRAISDKHMKACLYSGLKISGTNAEVMPGQWEYQIGPALGLEAGDHMWISRYMLQRIAETEGIIISLEPKLFSDWNGSGCHTNFSTKIMRSGE